MRTCPTFHKNNTDGCAVYGVEVEVELLRGNITIESIPSLTGSHPIPCHPLVCQCYHTVPRPISWFMFFLSLSLSPCGSSRLRKPLSIPMSEPWSVPILYACPEYFTRNLSQNLVSNGCEWYPVIRARTEPRWKLISRMWRAAFIDQPQSTSASKFGWDRSIDTVGRI